MIPLKADYNVKEKEKLALGKSGSVLIFLV